MWPNFWYSPIEILSAWLRGGSLTIDWPQFEGRRAILTHRSRISIALAYQFLRLSPGDEVLVPSYNCGAEIDPLLWCGAIVVFYRVDSHAMIDIEDIQAKVTSKTRAIYITHYFGWSQCLAELAKWCKERNLLLIEDCALSLLSEGSEGPVGCIGDAAIHCFWKTLPVPDGGALCLPKRNLEIVEKMRSPDFDTIFNNMQPFIKNWLRNRGKKYLGSFYYVLRKFYRTIKGESPGQLQYKEELDFPEMPPIYYFDEKIKDWGISRLSKGIINHADPNKIVQIRRRNYKQLYEAIKDLPGVQPLFNDLPEGVCPLVFPMLVSDPHNWQRSLNNLNVHTFRWWKNYHRSLSWEGFPEAIKLKNQLLAFHVHQFMNENQIAIIADSIKAVSIMSE